MIQEEHVAARGDSPQESKWPFYLLYPAAAFSTIDRHRQTSCLNLQLPGSTASLIHIAWSSFSPEFLVYLGYGCCIRSDSSSFYLLWTLSPPAPVRTGSRLLLGPRHPDLPSCPFGLHSPALAHSLGCALSLFPFLLPFTPSLLITCFSGFPCHLLCHTYIIFPFQGDYLVLNSRLKYSPWGSLSLLFSAFQLPTVPFVGLRPRELSPSTCTCLLLLPLFRSCLSNHVGETSQM